MSLFVFQRELHSYGRSAARVHRLRRLGVRKGENDVKTKAYVLLEGAELYSIGLHTFQSIAKDAGAVYKVKGVMLVKTIHTKAKMTKK